MSIKPKARKGRTLKIRTAPPDDPIYTRGFVLGGVGRNRLPARPAPSKPGAGKPRGGDRDEHN